MFLEFLEATTRARAAIRTLESLARIEEGAQGGRLPWPPGSLLTGFFPIPGVPRAATSTDVAPSRTDRQGPFLEFLEASTRARARGRFFRYFLGITPSVGAHRRPQRVGSAFSHHLVQSPNGHPRLLRSVAGRRTPRTDFASPFC